VARQPREPGGDAGNAGDTMTDATKETFFQLLREYGFATLVACFLGYVGRQT